MLRLRHVLTTTGATIGSGGLQLLLTLLAARLLSPEQNGHYAQFVLVFNLCFIAFNLGLGPASTYFLASGQATARQVLRVNALLLVLAGGLLALLAAAAAGAGGPWLESSLNIPVPVFQAGLAAGFAFLAYNQGQALLMGWHRYDAANALNITRNALPLLALVGVAAATLPSATSVSLAHLLGLALTMAVSLAVVLGLSRRAAAPAAPAAAPARAVAGRMLRYGGLVFASNLLHYLAMRGLLLVLSYHHDAAEVGFLNLALLLLELCLLVPSAIGLIVFPQSSTSAFQPRLIEAIVRINIGLGIAIAAALALMALPVLSLLLGDGYARAGLALAHLAPSVLLLSIPRILSQTLSGLGHPQYPLLAAVVSLLLGAALAVVVVPRWGAVGAAWVTNAVSLITAAVTLAGYVRVQRVPLAHLLLPRRADWQALAGLATRGR